MAESISNLVHPPISQVPVTAIDTKITADVFVRKYASLSDEAWKAKLLESAEKPELDDLQFPRYPDQETQRRIHGGQTLQGSIDGAFGFYQFIKGQVPAEELRNPEFRLLDYGAGWGRQNRAFLRDLPFNNIYGYEPNVGLCVMARKLNPYVNFINGGYMPDGVLPARHFDLAIGYSIFSHLSEVCAKAWLKEFSRILRPGGRAIMTTWGLRFMRRLLAESEKLARGEEIDWYSKDCIDGAKGQIPQLMENLESGKFIWYTTNGSTLYGDAFLPAAAITRWIDELGLDLKLVHYDDASLSQDVFVLQSTA